MLHVMARSQGRTFQIITLAGHNIALLSTWCTGWNGETWESVDIISMTHQANLDQPHLSLWWGTPSSNLSLVSTLTSALGHENLRQQCHIQADLTAIYFTKPKQMIILCHDDGNGHKRSSVIKDASTLISLNIFSIHFFHRSSIHIMFRWKTSNI